ncbi:MAG TPA: hypothetical protein VGP07_19295 [Polyangia bacterium]|jgi:tetratricopeptide (TPR) repeat protein
MSSHPRVALWTLVLLATVGGVFILSRRRVHGDGPYIPASDDVVVERLPRAAGDPRAIEAKRLRRVLAASPRDEEAAARLARLEIEDARSTSDPRHLGYAQAALTPWWTEADPPPAILVLRATIRQSRHDFPAALADLDRAAAVRPGDPQVWLTRAVVLSVLGRYDEADRSCTTLTGLSSSLIVTVCRAGVKGITGQAPQAAAALTRELASVRPGQDDPWRPWALSVLAEVTGWTGDRAAAERLSRQALALDPDDSYTRAQLADLLIASGRNSEVPEILRGREQNDGLLLRLAIADTNTRAPEAAEDVRQVADRFTAARTRGDSLHGREEARFELVIRHDPARALQLARANWQVQHEPADALILLQTALAARQAAAAAPALAWARQTGFQDPTVVALCDQLRSAP